MKQLIEKYCKFILVLVFFVMGISMSLCASIHKNKTYIEDFSYINDYNLNNNHYTVSGVDPGIGIVFDTPMRCDAVKLFFSEEHLNNIDTKIYYSNGNGLSEERVAWATLKQGSTKTIVDLPNKVYTELRIDIDGDFALNRIEIEQYGKYDFIFKIAAILFWIISVVFLLIEMISYDKVKYWLRNNYKAILIFVIIEVIVISYSTNVWKIISDKTTTSYHLETNYHTDVLKANGKEYYYNVDISDNKLYQFEFMMDVLSGNGDTRWKLYQGEECILTGDLQGDNFIQGVCRINLDKSIPYSEASYRISIEPVNDTSLQIYVDDNNYLNATYYYLFTYGDVLHMFVIIVNIVIGILMILLVSKLNVYVKFWIIAVSMGLLSIVVVIPCSTADEFRHFARAYSLANGEFATNYDDEGDAYTEIPVNLYNYRYMGPQNSISWPDETNFTLNMSREIYYLRLEDTKETVKAKLVGVDSKGLVEYFPQVIAMWIGKLLHVRQVWFFYIARFGNWIAIAMMWFATIHILPRHKMLFVVLYSMPTNIVYSCTSSTDGLLNALIMLIMAIAIKAYYDEIELTDKRVLIPVIIISVYISVIKLPYVLVAYSLVVPSIKLENNKYDLRKIVRNIVIILGICVLGYLVGSVLAKIAQMNVIASVSEGNSNAHIIFALEHFLEVIQVFIQTFVYKLDAYYREALAVNSLNIEVVVFPYSILMLYAASTENEKRVINGVQTLLLFFICIAMWGSVLLVAYFWSAIGATELWGIQGRYMCPIIMILMVALAMRKENKRRDVEERYIPAVCLGIMFVGITNIFRIQWL